VKFADFEIITRSRSVSTVIANRDDLAHLAIGLLEDNIPLPKAVRLLGVSLSSCKARLTPSRNWISGFELD
jgi:DNA polymerase-4